MPTDGRPWALLMMHWTLRRPTSRRVAIASWDARTVFGDLEHTWDGLLRGECIDDHVRVTPTSATRGRAMALARSVASRVGRAAGSTRTRR